MKLRDLRHWLAHYLLRQVCTPTQKSNRAHEAPLDLILCIVDHFEPRVEQASLDVERGRMATWEDGYPRLASAHCDSDGVPPQHTWFFPIDEYWDEHLESLSRLQQNGFGEVEVHLHHGYDTPDGVREKLERACKLYAQHGLLSCHRDQDEIRYAFIHGNWALDNSRGDAKWCGVNNELEVLQSTGCYADFTFPSLIYPTQAPLVNTLYYAVDDPHSPKSYDTGKAVQTRLTAQDGLMLVTGPVALNWHRRRHGLLPTIENADLSHHHLPSPTRVKLWVQANIHVLGQPNWVFIKLHTHGALNGTRELFTGRGGAIDQFFSELEQHYSDGERHRLHYVSARQMYNIIRAAEAGCTGNPHDYRDYELVLRS